MESASEMFRRPSLSTAYLVYLVYLSTAYLEAGYGRLPHFILPSFPIILITSVEIIAILNYLGLLFYAILSFICLFIEARL